jgi:hypothetical protein
LKGLGLDVELLDKDDQVVNFEKNEEIVEPRYRFEANKEAQE